jgi:hypothetical protein
MAPLLGNARHRAEADPRGTQRASPRRQGRLPRAEPPAAASQAIWSKGSGISVGGIETYGAVDGAVLDACCRSRVAGARRCDGRPRPDARRRDHQQHHGERDEAGRQQRYRRMQPHRRRDQPDGHPQPVGAERDQQAGQREFGATAPARLLPEPADHRLALPTGQPGHEVDRDPPRTVLRRAVQPGPTVRSRRAVLVANADHRSARSRRSVRTRTPKIHTGSPRRRTSSPEYNATDCHVHGKWADFPARPFARRDCPASRRARIRSTLRR